jgi:L-rhamnonate dehydratase
MKITNLRAVQPVAANTPRDWRTTLGQILVIVETSDGVTGYGVGGGGLAGVHVVTTVLRELLVGRDAEPVEELWEAMYRHTLPYGRKGIAIMAISGVDLALWDVRGKAAGKPVVELLGGKTGAPIRTYVTVWDDVPPEVVGKSRAYKLHAGGHDDHELEETVVRAVERARQAIGPDCELMLDAWMKWDVESTLRIADRIAAFNVGWIEEPLPADDFAGYEELGDRCPIPIAGGEHEFTAAAFREIIDRRLHQVLQPDVCWVGGLTELVKIYEMANRAGLRVCPHRGAELWGLHAVAALDPQPLAESGRPWMTWVGGQPPISEGVIHLAGAPGFGVTVDEPNLSLAHQ